MNRDEIIQKIDQGDILWFDEIPVDLQDEEMAKLWICCTHGCLKDLPHYLVTDEIRIMAMKSSDNPGEVGLATQSFDSICYTDTSRYEEIALLAIKNNYKNAWYVDHEILSEEFLRKALAVNGAALLPFLDEPDFLRNIGFELTQTLIDLAVSGAPNYFGSFKKHQYTREAVCKCIIDHDFPHEFLLNIDQFDALVDVIKSGVWPSHFHDQPKNLKNGIGKMMLMPDKRILYRAYVMTHPIGDVIAAMVGYYRFELLNMYSKAELAPFIKDGLLADDREFKGRLLANEMGL